MQYKHLIILTSSWAILSCSVDAQKITAGVFAGFNAAQVDGDGYAGYHRLGLYLAATAYVPLASNWFMTMDISYSERGARQWYNANQPWIPSFRYVLNYADIPLAVHLRHRDKFAFGTGGYVGRLLRCRIFFDEREDTCHFALRKYDIGWLASATYYLSSHWHFNIRFSYTVIPILNIIDRISGRRYQQYHNFFTLRVGYVF